MPEHTKLGMILEGLPPGRDAIHISIAPVVAGADLKPGQHVGFMPDSPDRETVYPIAAGRYAAQDKRSIGIVDPFLTVKIYKGQRFYVCLYPGRTTSLRHVWTHPAFEPESDGINDREFSEAWLRDFAERADTSYALLIEVAENIFQDKRLAEERGDRNWWPDYETMMIRYHTDLPAFMHSEAPTMWKHVAVVTGLPCSEETTCLFWCSC